LEWRERSAGPRLSLAFGVGGRKLIACGPPDAADGAACTDKNRGRRQRDKGHEQCVLDQILALFILEKTTKRTRKLNVSLW